MRFFKGRRLGRRGARLLIAALLIGASLVTFVLLYFQPQDLFINHTVNEALPLAGQEVTTASPANAGHSETVALGPRGSFRSGEHSTSGIAQLVTVPGRGTYLRLSHFRTSNGPAVHVWLSAAKDTSSGNVASAAHVDLGGLKGNIGNQNYLVPKTADLSRDRLVVIWCERFNVSFGTALLG
jgi:hypothetical protein